MAKNIIDKIWEAHVVESQPDYPDLFSIDLQLLHEVTSPQAFETLQKKGISLYSPDRVLATVDHSVDTDPMRDQPRQTLAFHQVQKLRENAKKFRVTLLDMNSGYQGIVHIIGPELGLSQPGLTIVCGDSHTSTHGALGAMAFGIGTSEISHVLASSCLLQHKPKTFFVDFKGPLNKGATAKDMVLSLIQHIGTSGGAGYFIEYGGSAIKELSMEERMTICNMSIECGARGGIISPDSITYNYLKDRPLSPKGAQWEKAISYWKTLPSDADASYDKTVSIDVTDLRPLVTWGINPAQSIPIDGIIPDPQDFDEEERPAIQKALDYVGLKPNTSIEGTPIDYVFIGSCTNARLSDLEQAAAIFKDHRVSPHVTAFVVPGSEQVKQQAIEKGLDKIFTQAGAQFREPGCSMCIAMNSDIVPPGKRCASTSNRNFIGRQGPGSITHLMSPEMAAAAAISGTICDVRKLKRKH